MPPPRFLPNTARSTWSPATPEAGQPRRLLYSSAMARDPVLTFTPSGIYCPAGDFYIDPWKPVDRALITHGHADHARAGHRHYLATKAAAPVIRHRLGNVALETTGFDQSQRIGAAMVSFHPAGHVPGSAQIRVEVGARSGLPRGTTKPKMTGCPSLLNPSAVIASLQKAHLPCRRFVGRRKQRSRCS